MSFKRHSVISTYKNFKESAFQLGRVVVLVPIPIVEIFLIHSVWSRGFYIYFGLHTGTFPKRNIIFFIKMFYALFSVPKSSNCLRF